MIVYFSADRYNLQQGDLFCYYGLLMLSHIKPVFLLVIDQKLLKPLKNLKSFWSECLKIF